MGERRTSERPFRRPSTPMVDKPRKTLLSRFRFRLFCWCFCLLCGALPRTAWPLEILAAGDVTLAGRMYTWPPEKLFSDAARERIEQAALFLWNCETSGLSSLTKSGNTFLFHADGRFFDQMRFTNGAAGTSNNHVFDGYEEGARNLLGILEDRGLHHNGIHIRGNYVPLQADSLWAPRIHVVTGSPMSQIGSGPVLVTLNYPALLQTIRELRRRNPVALIVVYAHDGIEQQSEATPRQILWAGWFARAGADVVLFAHSHMYGTFEVLSSTPRRTFVAWGLGNFLFGGNARWKDRDDVRLLSIHIDPVTGEKQGRWIFGRTRNWEFRLWGEE